MPHAVSGYHIETSQIQTLQRTLLGRTAIDFFPKILFKSIKLIQLKHWQSLTLKFSILYASDSQNVVPGPAAALFRNLLEIQLTH